MKRIRLPIFLLFVWGGGLFLPGEELIEAIVAIVNDSIITLSDYKEQHDAIYQVLKSQYEGEEFEKQYEMVKKGLLDQMITDLLLLQEAKKRGFNVSEQVRLTIENIKQENGLNSDEELRRTLLRQGIDFEEWRRQLEEGLLRQNVIVAEVDRGIVIDDSEVVKYYRLHPEEFTEPEQYSLKAIYISATGKSREEVEAIKKEINERLERGDDFSTLAAQYSEGPEKETQGSLGIFKKGELEKSLEEAVVKLEVGQRSPWIQVREGWYLLRIEERKESYLKPFDEVRKKIEEKLFMEMRQKKITEFLRELKARSYIKILIPNPWEV